MSQVLWTRATLLVTDGRTKEQSKDVFEASIRVSYSANLSK